MATTKLNIADLVARMPATDKEIEMQKPLPPDGTKKTRGSGDWESRGDGSKFTAPDPAEAEKIFDEILAGGRDSLEELVKSIQDPASPDFKNYKAEYLCHGLAVYVGRPNKAEVRRLFVDALTAQVADEKLSLHTRGFLTRELQLVGGPEAVSALGKLLTDEKLCTDAARTLLAIGNGAVEQLRAALPRVSGKCRLVLMQSLAACGDAASSDAMRAALADPDRDMRLAAVWGLARIADEGAADLLLKAADVAPSFERTKATQACLLLAENLLAAGKKKAAVGIYTRLRDSRTEAEERYIRDLAAKALRALGEG